MGLTGSPRTGSTAPTRLLLRSLRKLLLAGGSLLVTAAPNPSFAADFDLNGVDATLPQTGSFGDQPFLNGTDNLTNTGGANATLTEGGGAAGTVYSGIISDGLTNTTAIIHTSGEVTFTGNNTYTGGTSLYSGTVIVDNNNALGSGLVSLFSGSTLGLTNGRTVGNALLFDTFANMDVATGTATYSGQITDNAVSTLRKTGDGTLVLGNNLNDIFGGLTITRGVVRADADHALGTGVVTFDGGSLQVGASVSLQNNSFILTGVDATIDTQGFDLTLNGPIVESGGSSTLTKTGTGTLIFNALPGFTTYSSATVVQAGTLRAGAADVFSANSAHTIAAGATLDLGGFDQTIASLEGAGDVTNSGGGDAALTTGGDNRSTTFSGVISDGGTNTTALIKNGTGTLIFTGDNTYTGGTTINGGVLQLGAGGGTGSLQGDILNDGQLVVNRTGTILLDGDITGTGSLTKLGAGVLVLDGFNDYTGATTVLEGTLVGADDFALSEFSAFRVNDGASLVIDDGVDALIGSLADGPDGGGTVTVGLVDQTPGFNAFLTVGNDDTSTTFSGIITGVGSMAKIGLGTLTLTGSSALGEDLFIGDGVLHLKGGSMTLGGGVALPNGTLRVTDGADLVAADPFKGIAIPDGTMVVDGAGSTATTEGLTEVLSFILPSTLTISNGAVFNSRGGADVEGAAPGVVAVVNVLGAGSIWTVDNDLLIGCGCGFAEVNIASGGLVNSTGDTVIALDSTLNLGVGGLAGRIVTDEIENDGAIVANFTDTSILAADVFGTGTLAKRGSGKLILTGANTHTGGTTINGGTLQVGNGGIAGSLAGNVVDNGVLAFNRSNGLTFGGNITGTGGVEKLGAGVLSLSGNNTYRGATDILDGSLRALTGTSLSANSAFRVNDGASLLIDNGVDAFIGSLAGGPDGGGTVQIGTSAPLTTLVITGNASTSFSGVIVGAGGIEKQGTGVLTLTGLGSSFGELKVSNGTVDVRGGSIALGSKVVLLGGIVGGVLQVTNHGSVTAADNIVIATTSRLQLGTGGLAGTIVTPFIDNAGAIVADFTDTSTLAANIIGVGSLTKNGSGELILTGASSYTGATTVNGGILRVNGSIAGSPVTVNAGATLGGDGTVGTTVVNGGTLGPGNSPGTLTVRNSLAFGGGSTYAVEAGATTDRINVVAGPAGTGTASLSGGAVVVDYDASGKIRTRTLILDTAGGLGGTAFTGVTDDLTAVASALEYDADNAYLVSRLAVADQSGLTINQKNVATAIDDFFAGQNSFDLAFALDPAGLTTASGELGTGAIQAGFEASDRFLDVISDRFALPYEVPAGGEPAAYTEESASGTGAADAYASLLEKRAAHAMGTMIGGRWTTWGAVYGGAAQVDGDETVVGSHDLDTDVWGLAAGAGWREGDAGFGIALGGGHSSFDLADGLGSGDAGLFNAGIYGRADFGQAYFLGALAYGYHDVSTSRVAFGDTLDADYGAHSFSGRAELGYRFETSLIGLTPYAAFQGTALRIPSYSETGAGAFALDYDADTATAARGELGLRLDHTVAMDDAALQLSGRIAWAHAADTERSMVAGFQTLPGTSFIVYGAEPDSDSALVDLGAAMHWNNGWSAKLSFQGQFSGNYSSYAGSAKLGFAW